MKFSQRLSPEKLAFAYSFCSSFSVFIASFLEGTLYSVREININGNILLQHSYLENHSTIINFLLLNPLGIYFLVKAKSGFKKAYTHFGLKKSISPFNKFGLSVLSICVGISLMYFYFDGFIGKTFYTSAFEPNKNGEAVVSITGYLIFFWTSLYMSYLFFGCIEYGRYMLFLRSINPNRFGISVSNFVDRAIAIAIWPCTQMLYLLSTLFFVLVIFILRDFFQFSIKESIRIWLLIPYLSLGFCSLLPFIHLHNVMIDKKNTLITERQEEFQKAYGLSPSTNGQDTKFSLERIINSMDKIENAIRFYERILVWPVKSTSLTVPNFSFLLSLITLFYKVSSDFFAL